VTSHGMQHNPRAENLTRNIQIYKKNMAGNTKQACDDSEWFTNGNGE